MIFKETILYSGGSVCQANLGASCLHRRGTWCPRVPSLPNCNYGNARFTLPVKAVSDYV